MSPEGSRQLVAPVLSEVEGLEQGLLVDKRDRPRGQEVGVGPKKVTSGRSVDILHPLHHLSEMWCQG